MTPGTRLQNQIRNAIVDHGLFFRANVGRGWTGDRCTKVTQNRMVIENPRPFSTGLPVGFADLFGLQPVTITPDMVGQTIGVFSAIEVKAGLDQPSGKQLSFLSAVEANGGRSGIARSVEDAIEILRATT